MDIARNNKEYIIDVNSDYQDSINKLNRYLDDIKDSGYIAGGCFKNIILGEMVKDIDIFFESYRGYTNSKRVYLNKVEQGEFRLLLECDSLTRFEEVSTGVIVELVCKRIGKIVNILDSFDFTICKFGYVYSEEHHKYICVYHKYFENDLAFKIISLGKSEKVSYPIDTLNRVIRYSRYGYSVDDELLGKIIMQINGLGKDVCKDAINLMYYDKNEGVTF